MADQKSLLQLAIETRGRTYHQHPVEGFFGLASKPVHAIDFRVPTKADEDDAVRAAHAYAKQKCADDDEARRDPDLLTDAKLVELLYRCCFQPLPEQPDGKPPGSQVRYPSFTGGPDWMRKNLTSPQLAVLHNCLMAVSRKESPIELDLDTDRVDALASACEKTSDSDVPDILLARLSRDYLACAFVMLSRMYCRLRDAAVQPSEEPPA